MCHLELTQPFRAPVSSFLTCEMGIIIIAPWRYGDICESTLQMLSNYCHLDSLGLSFPIWKLNVLEKVTSLNVLTTLTCDHPKYHKVTLFYKNIYSNYLTLKKVCADGP